MPTYTIYAAGIFDNQDAIQSEDATPSYSSARAGTGFSGPGAGQAFVAQNTYQPSQGKYSAYYLCHEGYLSFDTSVIPLAETVNSAALSLYGLASGNSFYTNTVTQSGGMTLEAYAKNWGNYIGSGFIMRAENQVNASSGTTLTSSAISLNPAGMLIVSVTCTGASLPTLSITDTFGLGLGWTQVVASSSNTRTAIFYAQTANAAVVTGTVTVTSSVTITQAVMQPLNLSGQVEINAVVQTASSNLSSPTASSISTTLAASPSPSSLVVHNLGIRWGTAKQTITGPAHDGQYDASTGTGPITETYATRATGTTVASNTFSWSASTVEAGGMISLEIATGLDFVPGASLGALTKVATYTVPTGAANWSTSSYNVFSENGTNFQTAINKGGKTQLITSSDLMRVGTAPTGLNRLTHVGVNGVPTTDPKLVVTTTPAVTPASGGLMAMMGVG